MSAVSVSGTARFVEVADRAVGAALEGQPALGQEHPDRLDRVQRDPVGAGDDRPDGRLRQARHEPGEELAHRARPASGSR